MWRRRDCAAYRTSQIRLVPNSLDARARARSWRGSPNKKGTNGMRTRTCIIKNGLTSSTAHQLINSLWLRTARLNIFVTLALLLIPLLSIPSSAQQTGAIPQFSTVETHQYDTINL